MRVRFSKMHGLGNDFVVIDAVSQPVRLDAERIRRLADRHFGIGFDQLLLVERATRPDADFRYRIFNADGGEVQQCGNGARCFVRFVRDEGLSPLSELRVETAGGMISPKLEADGQVTVDMGPPRFEPRDIPFVAEARAPLYRLAYLDREVDVSALSMGNPHAVQVVADVDAAPVEREGPAIEHHPRFPERVNAGFMQVVSRRRIKLRVYERGAGETLACGTGACAAAVAGIRRGLLDSPVTVETRGGELVVAWQGDAAPVYMTGPAETVFRGEVDLG